MVRHASCQLWWGRRRGVTRGRRVVRKVRYAFCTTSSTATCCGYRRGTAALCWLLWSSAAFSRHGGSAHAGHNVCRSRVTTTRTRSDDRPRQHRPPMVHFSSTVRPAAARRGLSDPLRDPGSGFQATTAVCPSEVRHAWPLTVKMRRRPSGRQGRHSSTVRHRATRSRVNGRSLNGRNATETVSTPHTMRPGRWKKGASRA